MAERSTHYRLIEAKLAPVTFEDFIAARRPHKSWRTIAAELTEITDVEISYEVLRRWFSSRISYEVKVAPTGTPERAA